MPRDNRKTPSGIRITAAICLGPDDEPAAATIDSLIGQSLPKDEYEVLLIGGARSSPAGKSGRLAEIPNLRRVETSPDSEGERALALETAHSALVAFLDRRAVAEPGWLASFCRTFAQFGDAAQCVGGRVRPRWTTPRPEWLDDTLLPELSLIDLGEDARTLRPGERIAAANMACRKGRLNGGESGRFGDGGFAGAAADIGCGSRDLTSPAVGGGVYDPLALVEFPVPAAWLTQEWFRKRAARRAVADFVGAAPENAAEVAERWQAVKRYFFGCPPTERTVRGLVLRQRDPDRFRQQVSAVYDSTYCLLAGIGEDEYD